MSNHVALIDHEYTTLESGIRTAHADCVDHMDNVIRQLQTLDGRSVGFEARELTANISRLITELTTVKNTMSTIFAAHEEVLQSFGRTVDTYDSL